MKSPRPNSAVDEPEPPRILIVEDSAEGRAALGRVLEARGHRVETVATGEAALEALKSPVPPRIVITDLVLPDLDGREISRTARALQPRPWVVLITGWGFEATAEELASAGIDLLLPKPVDVRDLCRRLDAMLATGPPPA
jgi:CheY-like chemotaxis protein